MSGLYSFLQCITVLRERVCVCVCVKEKGREDEEKRVEGEKTPLPHSS